MLGRQARCKSCKRLFVIVPTEDEIELPQPTGSTTSLAPIEDEADDLEALASAASGTDLAPTHRRTERPAARFHNDDPDAPPRGPQRTAKGAKAAMGMGIAACVFATAGLVLSIIAMANGKNQSLLVVLGIIAVGTLAIACVLAMIAVVNGSSAQSKIKRARHPLGGKSQAATGTLTGAVALLIVVGCAITIAVYLARTGGIEFQEIQTEPKAHRAPSHEPTVA